MSNIIIKAENLSKAYYPEKTGTGMLSKDLEKWLDKFKNKEKQSPKEQPKSTHFWALKDINFEIEQGDTVGITGHNGSGKSTLLKILSRITAPTSGRITGRGRISSMLEIGTGFHPELTGVENIYLYGAMLGMNKKEIKAKFDEILSFAGLDDQIATPVKRYSSGMYMRLAFSVAAHLQTEIMIVDEVLAVGDTAFQQKCLDKMKYINYHNGKTILLVSHQRQNIKHLCKKEIVLINGQMI